MFIVIVYFTKVNCLQLKVDGNKCQKKLRSGQYQLSNIKLADILI